MKKNTDRKKYISIYLRNSYNNPSCYYRVFQYVSNYNNVIIHNAFSDKQYRKNINHSSVVYRVYLYAVHCLKRINALTYDLFHRPYKIVIQREIFIRRIPLIAKVLMKNVLSNSDVIWDFDDNIFISNEISQTEKKLLEEYSKNIIVTSSFLSNKLDIKGQSKVHFLPTTEKRISDKDFEEATRKRKTKYSDEINVVWVGTSGNLKYLALAFPGIDLAASKINKKINLIIVSNKGYSKKSDHVCVTNVKWTREATLEILEKAHIGIMPLENNEYSRGKGGFKLIQYLSYGVPVIASDVGYNSEVVSSSNGYLVENNATSWSEVFIKLATDTKLWEKYSRAALSDYDRKFAYTVNYNYWSGLLK